MVASCLLAALVLVPRDLSTFPAIFMASSMTLLFANFKHHLCHFVQVVQRQAQEVVHAAMQLERKADTAFFYIRRVYSSPSPPYRKPVTMFFNFMASTGGSPLKNSTGLWLALAAIYMA